MNAVIKVRNVDLIYRTTESLSVKKIMSAILGKKENRLINEYKALNNVSFELQRGMVYGFIGNNGAGKSTLLRVLSGAMSPNSGVVEKNYSTVNLLALGVGFSKELSGIENIFLNGMLLGFSKKHIASVLPDIINYSEIGNFIYKPMKTYSSGMVTRVGFSIAIHLRPEVLLIDEVLSVGDSRFREKSFQSLKNVIEDKNTTVVIVSHSMSQVSELCDYVFWLHQGSIIEHGDPQRILDLYQSYVKGSLSIDAIMKSV